MNTIISISMPHELKEALDAQVTAGRYRSLSAIVRKASAMLVKDEVVTENGFPVWFEDLVLKSAKEPVDYSREWDGKGRFSNFVRDKSDKNYGDKG